MADEETDTMLSTIYHALRAFRRREVVRALVDAEETVVTTRDLARKITATEQGIPRRRVAGEPYRNVYNALSQTHLPTLSEAGIVIYDPQRQTVSPGEHLALAALIVEITRPVVVLLVEEGESG